MVAGYANSNVPTKKNFRSIGNGLAPNTEKQNCHPLITILGQWACVSTHTHHIRITLLQKWKTTLNSKVCNIPQNKS